MRWIGAAVLAALASVLAPAAAPAQGHWPRTWEELYAAADSVGPEAARVAPTRWRECPPQLPRSDSLRVTGSSGEFWLASRSLRTRGYFTSWEVPTEGTGEFALLHVLCHTEEGFPYTFVLERDHRYFYLVFALRESPTWSGISIRREDGSWAAYADLVGERTVCF